MTNAAKLWTWGDTYHVEVHSAVKSDSHIISVDFTRLNSCHIFTLLQLLNTICTHRYTDKQTDRQTDTQTDRRTDRQTDRYHHATYSRSFNFWIPSVHTDRYTDKQTDRHIDTQTDRQTHRETDKQIDRQTDRYHHATYSRSFNFWIPSTQIRHALDVQSQQISTYYSFKVPSYSIYQNNYQLSECVGFNVPPVSYTHLTLPTILRV